MLTRDHRWHEFLAYQRPSALAVVSNDMAFQLGFHFCEYILLQVLLVTALIVDDMPDEELPFSWVGWSGLLLVSTLWYYQLMILWVVDLNMRTIAFNSGYIFLEFVRWWWHVSLNPRAIRTTWKQVFLNLVFSSMNTARICLLENTVVSSYMRVSVYSILTTSDEKLTRERKNRIFRRLCSQL